MSVLKAIKKKKEVGDFIKEIENKKNQEIKFPVHAATEKFADQFTFNSLMVCARSHGYRINFHGNTWRETDGDLIKVTSLKDLVK